MDENTHPVRPGAPALPAQVQGRALTPAQAQAMAQAQAGPPWGPLDDHLLYTCGVVHDLTQGRLHHRPPLPTTARLHPGELSLASGPAARSTWRALGDGSYNRSSTMAMGSTGFVVGALAVNAMGNASRRNQAMAAAQPRWVVEGQGEVTVTDQRAIFSHPQSWLDLPWNGLATMDLAGPDTIECAFHDINGKGYTTVRLHSLWASLIFVLAAHAAFPAHPRLLTHGWLPPGFEARAAAYGRPCPSVR
ncbi:hypothetical protein [Streptomyces candidus]|uniref:Uncharacterized protein n=1 Tax=Streptomyces candidus TaxID=67283 RepID=A0A7X0HHG6_9ACTN|nr:hypothetical protein [Streptomyces candidus]MBB6437747.1 hypothetical protein [Streptomyces candidus]GHH50363.1 hypothetical protein GCM10018773_47250 [Streptomyces candidus]